MAIRHRRWLSHCNRSGSSNHFGQERVSYSFCCHQIDVWKHWKCIRQYGIFLNVNKKAKARIGVPYIYIYIYIWNRRSIYIYIYITLRIGVPYIYICSAYAWFHVFRPNILYVTVHAACPIHFIVSTLSRWWFFFKSSNYEAPTYTFFTILLLVFLCQFHTHTHTHTFLCTLFSKTTKLSQMWETKFHTHIRLLCIGYQSQTNYSVEPFIEDLLSNIYRFGYIHTENTSPTWRSDFNIYSTVV